MERLKKIWARIYPTTDKEHWWMPLIWLPFMFWFFVAPMWKHASLLHWIVNTIVGIVFIWLYLQAFARGGRMRVICTLIMLATRRRDNPLQPVSGSPCSSTARPPELHHQPHPGAGFHGGGNRNTAVLRSPPAP